MRRLPDGTLNQVFRGLLNVDYSLGLSHIPDIISGSASTQAAYYWSTQVSNDYMCVMGNETAGDWLDKPTNGIPFQTIPVVQNAASGGGRSYVHSSSSSYPFLPPFADAESMLTSGASAQGLHVWPFKPLAVNTDLWRRLSGAPCASADNLLEKLNVYTPALAPYIGMNDVQVCPDESAGFFSFENKQKIDEMRLSSMFCCSIFYRVFFVN